MTHSSFFRYAIVVVVAFALFFTSSIELRAQTASTYKRGVFVEEVTGTWCGFCPRGAWYMDSLESLMPDNAILVAWHNADIFTIAKTQDTIEQYIGVSVYPNVSLQRSAATGIGDFSQGDILYSNIKKAAKQDPLVDFRIVNVTFSPAAVDFDLDVTPYDIAKMTSEDTASYVLVVVLTEDNLVESQHHYIIDPNTGAVSGQEDFSDFVHMNVARRTGGKVLGDKFTLGTKAPNSTAYPVRTHYSVPINSGWTSSNLRIKAFIDGKKTITVSGKKYESNTVYNAAQTQYVSTYPAVPPAAAWVVLPNANSIVKPNVPTNIIWATGGSVGPNVKLEYSVDNGAHWNLIIASTNKSPYAWNMPTTAYGGTAMVRVSDANSAATNGVSQVFKTPGVLTVTKPALGEVITGGTADYVITYTGGNLKAALKFEYSTDNGATWNTIGTLGNADGTSYNWATVVNPATDATQSLIRISDANGVIGTSQLFTIKANVNIGTLSNVKASGLDNANPPHIASNKTTTITWTSTGNVGSNLIVEYTVDNTITWHAIGAPVAPTALSTPWTTPDGFYANGCFVRVRSSDADKANVTSQSAEFAIGASAGVNSNSVNGYSISNYPNPFAGSTTIKFELPVRTFVTIRIQDELGREIDKLVTEIFDAGAHSITYNATNISNGVYTYTLEAGTTKLVGKMSLVK